MFKADMSRVVRVLLALVFFGVPFASSTVPVEILQPGTFHEDEVRLDQTGTWLCLVETSAPLAGFELQTCDVKVEPVSGFMGEDGIGHEVSVTGSGSSEPLVMIRGLEAPAGPVETCFSGRRGFLNLRSGWMSLEGCKDESGHTIWLISSAQISGRLQDPRITDFTLQMKSGKNRGQEILRIDHVAETDPSLLWAGDLDRDGEVDMFMDVSGHYNCRVWALFLSGSEQGYADPVTFTSCGC